MGNFSVYAKHKDAPKLKYVGIFDFDKIYRTVLALYSEKVYLVTEKKNVQKTGGTGTEVEIEVYGYRNETEYVQFELTTFMHSWDMENVDVLVNGEKKTLQKGRLIIDFEAKMNTDYSKEFETTTFLKKVKKLYDTKLMVKTLGAIYDDKIYYEMYKFHAAVKEASEMYSAYNAF